MATLLDWVDPHIVVNGHIVASSSLTPAALKAYVLNHPTVLRAGYSVSNGQIVQTPQPGGGIGQATGSAPTSGRVAPGVGFVPPNTPAPGTGKSTPTTPTTPVPTPPVPATPAPPPVPQLAIPTWIGNLFPNGLTTNPGAGAGPQSWSPELNALWQQSQQASAVDPEYAQAYSDALLAAMQQYQPLQSKANALLAVNPQTGKTQYQQQMEDLNRSNTQAISSAYGNAAARGIGSSGMVNQNLAKQANVYQPAVGDVSNTYGDAALANIGKDAANITMGLNMSLVNAFNASAARARAGQPTITAPTTGSN